MPEDEEKFDNYLKDLQTTLRSATNLPGLYQMIVNAPFSSRVEAASLYLGIVVLLIENKNKKEIDRVALSNTELANNTKTVSVVPFEDIKIPLSDPENIISVAIRDNQHKSTTDWRYLFTPVLAEMQARINQAAGGIACSYVYPIHAGKKRGALIFSYYQYLHAIGELHEDFMERYSAFVSAELTRLSRVSSSKVNKV